jgi:malate permease and related proteins
VFDVLLNVILPVLLVAGLGGVVARMIGMPVAPLSQLSFYLLGPALVFDGLSTIELSGGEAAKIVAAVAMSYVATMALGYGGAAIGGLDRGMRSAVGLTSATSNGGNMGLPVVLLAFGDSGLDIAVIAFVSLSILTNVIGIFVASLAGGSARAALTAPLRVPSLWAAAMGLLVNALEIDVPTTIAASAGTMAEGSIPVMLIVLGLHLSKRPSFGPAGPMALTVAIRLVAGPFIAWGAVSLLGIDGMAHDTLIVLGGMPTAVNATIIATQYQTRPDFVTKAVIASTVASIATSTVLVSMF